MPPPVSHRAKFAELPGTRTKYRQSQRDSPPRRGLFCATRAKVRPSLWDVCIGAAPHQNATFLPRDAHPREQREAFLPRVNTPQPGVLHRCLPSLKPQTTFSKWPPQDRELGLLFCRRLPLGGARTGLPRGCACLVFPKRTRREVSVVSISSCLLACEPEYSCLFCLPP